MRSRFRLPRWMAAMAMAIVLVLTGCPGTGAPGGAGNAGGKRVGVAMPTEVSERWIADGNAVKEQLEAAGFTVDLQYANDDIPTQTQQIDQMITNGANYLIIASIDGTALSAQLDAAGAAGIPVVAYDRLIRDSQHVDFYVSFDNYKVGVAQANALLFGLGLVDAEGKPLDNAPAGPFNIELFAGSPDDNNARYFFNGAVDTLQPYLDAGTLIVKSGQTDFDQTAILRWSQEGAQKRMEDLLTSTYTGGGQVDAVLSPFDGISRGIINALQSGGYGSDLASGLPVVTGQDADIASVKLINDGVQQSTIFKDTRTLATEYIQFVSYNKDTQQVEVILQGACSGCPSSTMTLKNGIETLLRDQLESPHIQVIAING